MRFHENFVFFTKNLFFLIKFFETCLPWASMPSKSTEGGYFWLGRAVSGQIYCASDLVLWKLFGSGSEVVRAWFGHGSGVVRAWFGRGSGAVRAWFGHGSGTVRARSGVPVFGKTQKIIQTYPVSSFLAQNPRQLARNHSKSPPKRGNRWKFMKKKGKSSKILRK